KNRLFQFRTFWPIFVNHPEKRPPKLDAILFLLLRFLSSLFFFAYFQVHRNPIAVTNHIGEFFDDGGIIALHCIPFFLYLLVDEI
ncbi:MAG: hypothetical protein Q8P67_18710, partial [archaeon]|nr:hypothetical protein [archaeon]